MLFLQYILILFIVILINNINTSTVDNKSSSIHGKVAIELSKIDRELKNDEEQLKTDRLKFDKENKLMEKSIKMTDVIRLNVGGEIIMTTRETLTRVPKSILCIMFNGRWEHKLEIDKNGNIFFDFNPILFRYLLDQLQLFDINSLNTISLPFDSSLVLSFKKMIKRLGLNQLLLLSSSSENNIIIFNVGGQLIANRRTTFTQLSNSIISSSNIPRFYNKSHVFVDYNVTLFRHLISQLREGSSKNTSYFKGLLSEEKISFKRMLIDLNISQQLIASTHLNNNTKWKENGITIAGGNNNGSQLNQLSHPWGIYIDNDDQSIYIAEYFNHRIVQWKYGAKSGQLIAGGNGQGNQTNQLNNPVTLIIDKKNDSFIICDRGNRQVIQLSRHNSTNIQTIISDIDCYGLTMDNNRNLYVSDYKKNEVTRWKIGNKNGTIVAGGNGKGNDSNQLSWPTYIFVDKDHSIYVSDTSNFRVMKWIKDAKEGIIVAGGQDPGYSLEHLSCPLGIFVDDSGNVYVADSYNYRIVRWLKNCKEGTIVVGGYGKGEESKQFNIPEGLSFDREGNIYVADSLNHRIQRFDIESN